MSTESSRLLRSALDCGGEGEITEGYDSTVRKKETGMDGGKEKRQ